MRILVINPGAFTGNDLIVGEEYDCIPVEGGTGNQNRAFHSLLQKYWQSGCHSYNARSFGHFRALIKLYLGARMEKFCNVVNVDGSPCPIGRKDYRLKSWTDYSKRERKETIDRLISEMKQAGVNSVKFEEILKGMEKPI